MCKDCSKVLTGVVSVAMSLAGVGLADPEIIQHRRSTCDSCPKARPCKRLKGVMCQCSVCECMIGHKVRLAHEKCPLYKW